MPNLLTTAQLIGAKAMIADGNVLGFYDYMASQGYGYANLAKGVVECTLLSGGSTAQNFMVQEAARRGITMTEQKVLDVERIMAYGYVDTLIENARAGGTVNLDIRYREALDFHTSGFERLGLPKELWTLYKPSEVLSNAKLEANWQQTIDPAQSGGLNPAWNFSTGFGLDMGLAAQQALLAGNLGTFARAAEWSAGVSLAQAASASSAAGITQDSAGCNAAIAASVEQRQNNAAAMLSQSPVAVPENLGTPARNSANFITSNATDRVTVGAGGTVSDIWLLQKNAGNVFTLEEFGKAILANNPGITDINAVQAGQVIYVPQKQTDGSVTYNYAGGASINSNAASGEYHMVVPNTEGGGQTVYSRTYDGNALGGESWTVRQVSTNAVGAITFSSTGWQESLTSDIKNLSAFTLNGAGSYDAAASVNGSVVAFEAAYNSATDSFRASEITSINGAAVDAATAGLDPTDLEAFGFVFDKPLPASAQALVAGLNPVAITANGWPTPVVVVTPTADGGSRHTIELGNGTTLTTVRNDDRRVISVSEEQSTGYNQSNVASYQVNGDGTRTLLNQGTRVYSNEGGYTDSLSTPDGQRGTYSYSEAGELVGSTSTTSGVNNISAASVLGTLNDVVNFGRILGSNVPGGIKLAHGAILLNQHISAETRAAFPVFGTAANVAQGALSLYSLSQAFGSGGSDIARVSAVANALNLANRTLITNNLGHSGLNTVLNGSSAAGDNANVILYVALLPQCTPASLRRANGLGALSRATLPIDKKFGGSGFEDHAARFEISRSDWTLLRLATSVCVNEKLWEQAA